MHPQHVPGGAERGEPGSSWGGEALGKIKNEAAILVWVTPKKFGIQVGTEASVRGSTRDVATLSPPALSGQACFSDSSMRTQFSCPEDKGLYCIINAMRSRVRRWGGRGQRAQLEQVQKLPSALPSWWPRLQAAPDSRGDGLKESPCDPHMIITGVNRGWLLSTEKVLYAFHGLANPSHPIDNSRRQGLFSPFYTRESRGLENVSDFPRGALLGRDDQTPRGHRSVRPTHLDTPLSSPLPSFWVPPLLSALPPSPSGLILLTTWGRWSSR